MKRALEQARTLLSFVAVGSSSAATYVFASMILAQLGLQPWLASFISYSALVPLAYLGQRSLTFRSESPHALSFPRYIAIQLIGLTLAAALPRAMADSSPIMSFVLVAVVISLTNFALLRWWAFPKNRK